MCLADYDFLTDENIDSELVAWLRNKGLSVFDAKEEALFGTSDLQLLELAKSMNRVIISQDSDFGTLVFRDKVELVGILFLRPGHQDPRIHLETLEAVFSTSLEPKAPFILVAEHKKVSIQIRLREL